MCAQHAPWKCERGEQYIGGKAPCAARAGESPIPARFSFPAQFHGKFRAERHCGRSWLTYERVCICAIVLRWLIVERDLYAIYSRACLLTTTMNETSVNEAKRNGFFQTLFIAYISSSNKYTRFFFFKQIEKFLLYMYRSYLLYFLFLTSFLLISFNENLIFMKRNKKWRYCARVK